jgi:hypothetical protein
MTDELTVCAAAFLRNKGKTVVTENEFLMGVSMDYHWMPYSDAKKLLAALMGSGVFKRNGEYLEACFSVSDVNVPVAYRPSESLINGVRKGVSAPPKKETVPQPENLLSLLISESMNANIEKRDFMSAANALQKTLNVDILVAGLIVLRDAGVDITHLADRVYEAVSKK